MTETRDKLNAFVDSMPVTDALKGELKRMLDDLEEEAFTRGVNAEGWLLA